MDIMSWVGQPQSRFYCDVEQESYKNVTFMYLTGILYFLSKLFTVPSFRPVLEALFPDRMVLTSVLREVMLPSDQVWALCEAYGGRLPRGSIRPAPGRPAPLLRRPEDLRSHLPAHRRARPAVCARQRHPPPVTNHTSPGAARKFDFEADAPFETSDILDLQSVVKHLSPVCVDARDLLESGKVRLAQCKLNEAYEAFSEAFTILQQVCGPMHREVANWCRYLAMVLYHAGDMTGAIMQQHKELIINERCLGSDHPDTAHSYGNMALFYHGLNQTELALGHMAHTLVLLNVSCGSNHPDVAATLL